MISNPCSWFIDGNNRDEFTYEGGSKLYHFCPADNKIIPYYAMNIVFFANDIEHAKDVLLRMFNFYLDTAKRYISHLKKSTYRSHADEFESATKSKSNLIKECIAAIESGKAKITEAPMNQFYKVGWGSNDTL